MHARVVLVTLQRDRIDECIDIFRDSIVPEARRQKGFSDYLLLTDRDTGHCIVFSLWESEADLHASETSGYYSAQVAKLQPMFVSQPMREICEVTVHELRGLTGAALHGRVTTAMFQHDKINEGTQVFRDSIVPEARKQPGFEGVISVADRDTGKSYTLSCWDSEANRQAGESSGYYQAQVAKLRPYLIGQTTRESFDLTLPAMATIPQSMGAQPHPPTP